MSFFQRLFSRPDSGRNVQNAGDADAPDVSLRRRNFANLAPAEGETFAAESQKPQEKKALKAEKKPNAPKQPKAKIPSIMESISVVMRRQVPIRFDEEARSWIGGLPKMPVGMEWPRAKPKKPLHFMAQINCADLPPELWGGLGPREGWLLLFADMEALTEDMKRPLARVIHVTELGPDAEPPSGLYWARNDLVDVSWVKGTLPGAQRQHFRQWPVDLVPLSVDTSELTGRELYGAPESKYVLTETSGFAMIEHPMTWRGAYTILAGLVTKYDANGYESNWRGNSLGMLDYPEPDISERNGLWKERRERIAAQLSGGYYCREFTEAQAQLEAQLYEERRQGWTRRAFKVLEETLVRDAARLESSRSKVAEALARGDEKQAKQEQGSVEYYENLLTKYEEDRSYLKALFAQYPSEETLVAEINRVGRAHLEWAQRTQDQLRALLDHAGKNDLDAPIAPSDWDDIAAQLTSMKSCFWQKTFDTDLLRKVERNVSYASLLREVARDEALDRYVSSPASSGALDGEIVAELEPKLRHLESERPHKMGGIIDSVYDDPLKKGHILLFQIASDAATGWIMGDVGLLYVSIDASDLKAGSFDNVRAWLEA
jgi:uncharacterized protein YwqG